LDARTEFKISQRSLKGGGEAGRAFDYRQLLLEPDNRRQNQTTVAKAKQPLPEPDDRL